MLIVLLIAAAALLAAGWWAQERIAYQPPRVIEPLPAGAQRVVYTGDDGQPLFALVVGAPDPPARRPAFVLIAFHGNADLAAWLVPWAIETARRTGAAVVLPEYRGYGGLTGRPTAAGIRHDARAANVFARARFGQEARVAYFGHSLGSAVATELAAEAPPSVLVLESPFTSARAMAGTYGTPLLRWLWPVIGRIPYDTEARGRALDVPLWVAHGDRDRVVPVRQGRAVFAAARRPGELLIIPGGGHNGLAHDGGALYWNWLERALR